MNDGEAGRLYDDREWSFTVASLSPNSEAICLLRRPATTSVITSHLRGVSRSFLLAVPQKLFPFAWGVEITWGLDHEVGLVLLCGLVQGAAATRAVNLGARHAVAGHCQVANERSGRPTNRNWRITLQAQLPLGHAMCETRHREPRDAGWH